MCDKENGNMNATSSTHVVWRRSNTFAKYNLTQVFAWGMTNIFRYATEIETERKQGKRLLILQ